MRSNHTTPCLGDRRKAALHRLLKHIDRSHIVSRLVMDFLRSRGTRCSQCVSNVVDVVLGICQALPGMGIGLAANHQRGNAAGGDNNRTSVFRSLYKPVDPTFEVETMDEYQLRLRNSLSIEGGRFEYMRVRVRQYQTGNGDAVATDSAHHIGEDREASHHLQRRALSLGQ